MKRAREFCLMHMGFLLFLLLSMGVLRNSAQTPLHMRMDEFAGRIADRMRAAHLKRVLLGPLRVCTEGCFYFEDTLAESLRRVQPNLEIISRERFADTLEQQRLQGIDFYVPGVVRGFGRAAGADTVVLGWATEKDRVDEVTVALYDCSRNASGTRIGEEHARIPQSELPAAPQSPIQDSRSGAYVAGIGGIGYPQCAKCPDPKYTDEARLRGLSGGVLFIGTILPEGRVTDLVLLSGLGAGLDESGKKAVLTWRFKPAKGLDGNPVATRVPIEANFKLGPR